MPRILKILGILINELKRKKIQLVDLPNMYINGNK